jgi:hypothetical protein
MAGRKKVTRAVHLFERRTARLEASARFKFYLNRCTQVHYQITGRI